MELYNACMDYMLTIKPNLTGNELEMAKEVAVESCQYLLNMIYVLDGDVVLKAVEEAKEFTSKQ